ncbi:MAG: hypothetical protein IH840_14580 [Candidatus Heimdallarchaeota archaeon]|nr:hypothetical protein [Candidatus Heimdallarchaeota archaeon]
MSLKNFSAVDGWRIERNYRKITIAKCPKCEVYFEPLSGDECPGCYVTDLENVQDRIEAWIEK